MNMKYKGYYLEHNSTGNIYTYNLLKNCNGNLYFTDVSSDSIYRVYPDHLEMIAYLKYPENKHNLEMLHPDHMKDYKAMVNNGEFYKIGDYAIADDYIIISIATPLVRIFLYNIHTKDLTEITQFNTGTKKLGNIPRLCNVYGEFYVGVESSEFSHMFMEDCIDEIPKDNLVRRIYDSTKPEDNPVIVLLHPKKR